MRSISAEGGLKLLPKSFPKLPKSFPKLPKSFPKLPKSFPFFGHFFCEKKSEKINMLTKK